MAWWPKLEQIQYHNGTKVFLKSHLNNRLPTILQTIYMSTFAILQAIFVKLRCKCEKKWLQLQKGLSPHCGEGEGTRRMEGES